MLTYINFTITPLIAMPVTAIANLFGGWWLVVPIALVVFGIMIIDNIVSNKISLTKYRATWYLSLIPYLQLPTSLFVIFTLVWQASPDDLLGFGVWFSALTGLDIVKTGSMGIVELIFAGVSTGFVLSTNTVAAHELVHKTQSFMAMMVGRWTLAVVGDAQFSVSHIYAHHLNVATFDDAASARRNESIYQFIFRSTIGQYIESWAIEKIRLKNKNMSIFSLNNRVITGVLMTLILFLTGYLAAGFLGIFALCVVIVVSKFLFETVNYIQHYGLVRVPGEKVKPRHSWDCNNVASSYMLINLTRHSDHHTNPRGEYWQLEANVKNIGINQGYIVHMSYTLIPSFWFKLMERKLKYWELNFASEAELEIVRSQKIIEKNISIIAD